jgi:hypothetical protein
VAHPRLASSIAALAVLVGGVLAVLTSTGTWRSCPGDCSPEELISLSSGITQRGYHAGVGLVTAWIGALAAVGAIGALRGRGRSPATRELRWLGFALIAGGLLFIAAHLVPDGPLAGWRLKFGPAYAAGSGILVIVGAAGLRASAPADIERLRSRLPAIGFLAAAGLLVEFGVQNYWRQYAAPTPLLFSAVLVAIGAVLWPATPAISGRLRVVGLVTIVAASLGHVASALIVMDTAWLVGPPLVGTLALAIAARLPSRPPSAAGPRDRHRFWPAIAATPTVVIASLLALGGTLGFLVLRLVGWAAPIPPLPTSPDPAPPGAHVQELPDAWLLGIGLVILGGVIVAIRPGAAPEGDRSLGP